MTEEAQTMEDVIKEWNAKTVEMFLDIRKGLVEKGFDEAKATEIAKVLTPRTMEIVRFLLAQTVDVSDWGEETLDETDDELEKAIQEFQEQHQEGNQDGKEG